MGGRLPGLSWLLLGLAAACAAGLALRPEAWNWQAGLWLTEPWRLWTCVAVHGSVLHAAGNCFGALLLAALAARAQAGRRELLALLLAWPLTHALLALRPDLPAYFGASGLLHGAATLIGLRLLQQAGRARAVGAALLAGLALKLGLEQPWGPALRDEPFWGGMATVPWAHASGVIAGVVCGLGGLRARGASQDVDPGTLKGRKRRA
ncbi:MAG: rhombosortase [Inhella sp.]